jgi:TonB family protein
MMRRVHFPSPALAPARTRSVCRSLALVALASLFGACSAPAPPAAVSPSTPTATAPAVPDSSAPGRPVGPVKLAPRDPALEAWKRAAAERIHAANQKYLFEGRPHHLLQAVIVVEATVDRGGNVVKSRVTRSPKIRTLDDMALASLKAASPLPAPPASLLVHGNLVFSETFLVNNDSRFQVRTLALPQD